jgi:hypothetical protein
MSKELIGYLESQLKALKLKGMLTHYQEITQKAAQNNLSYPGYLSLLLDVFCKTNFPVCAKWFLQRPRQGILRVVTFHQ